MSDGSHAGDPLEEWRRLHEADKSHIDLAQATSATGIDILGSPVPPPAADSIVGAGVSVTDVTAAWRDQQRREAHLRAAAAEALFDTDHDTDPLNPQVVTERSLQRPTRRTTRRTRKPRA